MRTQPVFRAIPAFVQLFNAVAANAPAALAQTWPWLVLLVLLNLVVSPSSGWVGQAGHFAVGLVAFASMAVTWHRYLLRGELAHGFEVLRLDGRVWRYAWSLLVLSIPAFILGIIISVPVLLLAAALSVVTEDSGFSLGFELAMLLSMALPLAIFNRLGIRLPSIALGEDRYGFGEAWRDSKGFFLPISGFSLLAALIYLPSAWLTEWLLVTQPASAMALLGGALLGAWSWLAIIIAITALTILYAVFVEGEEL